jgi:uncharacterized membrane protein
MYRGRLKRDLALSVDKGLLDRPKADALLGELDSRPSAFSVGHVLLILAAVLVAAAILLLVAANWEAIPRPARAAGLVLLIWVFHLAAGLAQARGAMAIGAALLVLGAASFGAALSLLGQMYHLSGDVSDMMIVWFCVTGISAALFRSPTLTGFAGLLAWAALALYIDDNNWTWDSVYGWMAPVMALSLLALVYWTGAARVRHMAYLLMIAWLVWLYGLHADVTTAIALAGLGMAGFLAVSLAASPLHGLAERAGAAPAFYTFLLAVIGLGLLHFDYEIGVALALLGLVTLAFAIAGIALSGRDNGAVRYLAYLIFSAELLYLSFVTIDTILGTSAFFLVSGLVVALLAWLAFRLEKRFAKMPREAGS